MAGSGLGISGLNPSVTPLAWPTMPLVPALAIAVAALAAVAAPPPVRKPTAARGSQPPPSERRPVASGTDRIPGTIEVPA